MKVPPHPGAARARALPVENETVSLERVSADRSKGGTHRPEYPLNFTDFVSVKCATILFLNQSCWAFITPCCMVVDVRSPDVG